MIVSEVQALQLHPLAFMFGACIGMVIYLVGSVLADRREERRIQEQQAKAARAYHDHLKRLEKLTGRNYERR